MLGITQDEVRRHPRWREELRTPSQTPNVQRMPGSRLLGVVAVLIVFTALAVLILQG
jgi:membrane protein required for beta-lactamase induction